MRFKWYGILLSLFFALGLVFSFRIDASATHEDSTITAEDVAGDPGNETKMTEFVDRIVDYYEHVRSDYMSDRAALIRHLTIFARDIRGEGGDYRYGEIYAIGVTDNFVVTNHARYPELIGYTVNRDAGTPLAETFKALLNNSAIGDTNCENYGQNRVACAEKVKVDLTVDVTNIAGLHHKADDAAFVPPDCSGLTLDISAENVSDDPTNANLEAYVKGVIEAVQKDIAKITAEELTNPTLGYGKDILKLAGLQNDTAKQQELKGNINTRVQERLFCFGSGDFKHKNIYAFIMSADPADSTVIVNGNNFDLNGTNLELEDDQLSGEKNIARLFNNALGGGAVGNSAYVDYHWDDPLDPNDDVAYFFRDKKVPGTSPKRSYVEVGDLNELVTGAIAKEIDQPESIVSTFAPVFFPPELYIFGSGIYNPPEMMDDDMMDDDMMDDDITTTEVGGDSGCAIAGAGHTSQSTLLNLFLIASVLFSVVFLRKRA